MWLWKWELCCWWLSCIEVSKLVWPLKTPQFRRRSFKQNPKILFGIWNKLGMRSWKSSKKKRALTSNDTNLQNCRFSYASVSCWKWINFQKWKSDNAYFHIIIDCLWRIVTEGPLSNAIRKLIFSRLEFSSVFEGIMPLLPDYYGWGASNYR